MSFIRILNDHIADAKEKGDEQDFVTLATNIRKVILAASAERERTQDKLPLTGRHVGRVLDATRIGRQLLSGHRDFFVGLDRVHKYITNAVHILDTAKKVILPQFLNAPPESRAWNTTADGASSAI